MNFSISVNADAAGMLRHLGFEDPAAPTMSVERDSNGIEWERFTAEQQQAEIFQHWPDAQLEPPSPAPETTRRSPHVVTVAEVEGTTSSTGATFGSTRKHLGVATGGRQLGCSWYEVPPGRSAFPRHFHCANEEAIYVLEGEGRLRLGEETLTLSAGAYVTIPVGPNHAHQFANTGESPLRYLCLSTMHPTEVVGYPDSKKVLALGSAPSSPGSPAEPWIRLLAFEPSSVGYFDGEDLDRRDDQ
ncbi:MAG TPA: cupin domain-containing protein [Polyangiaceae bacterium]|nr:cupin domain-containing protein [Polyangiaceae bacterium]